MLVVETIAKIRRAFFVQGKAIKAICRDLGVSRKVVRKVIRSGSTEFRYEREDQPLPKIGRWRDTLDQLLLANEAKASRERLTLIRIFEELRGQGYDGGYDAVRRYASRWAKKRGQATAVAYVPLSFAPGEAYQFDWSHEVVVLSGVTVIVKVAHVRLCHSRMLFVRAYRETQITLTQHLGAPPSGADRANDLGSVRSGAIKARSLCGSVRRIPRGASVGLEDLLGPLRQQQVLGGRQRDRASG